MKRLCALMVALAILAGMAGAYAVEAGETDPRSRLDQARATKNPAVCLALLLSVVNSPDATDELVGEAMDLAWESDLIKQRDMIDLMLAVWSIGKPELDRHAESLPYILARTGRADEAIGILRGRIESDPDNAPVYGNEIVDVLVYDDREDEAMEVIGGMVADNTASPDSYAKLADILNRRDMYAEAVEAAEAGLADDPRNTRLLQSYAEALSFEYRYAEAADAVRGKLRVEQSLGYDVTYTYLLLHYTQSRAGLWDEAARSMEHALSGDQDSFMFLERARFRLWELYDPEAALKDLNALLKRDPDDTDALFQRAYAYLWLDRYDEAMEDARALAEHFGEWPSLMEAVVAHYAGDIEEADAMFARLVDDNPSDSSAWLFRAMNALYGAGDLASADEYLDYAEDIADEDSDILSLRGDAARHAGRWTEAAELYLRSADLAYEDATPLNSLGVLLCERGMLDEARDTLARAEREYPNHYWTLCLRLTLEAAEGDYSAALGTYDSIAAQFPFMARGSLRYINAALLAMDGQTGESAAVLDTLETSTPDDMLAAAECGAMAGDYAKAREWLALAADAIGTAGLTPGGELGAEIIAKVVSAEIAYLEGDEAACLDSLRGACLLGWYPEAVKGNWILKGLAGSDGYAALAEEYPVE
ncbi:MAG: tetratricopeptide repeat protein [Oscillospiraceae bacterium]|nr:tetratricopeptide repeat protein [Oscillospiraceae bacterium]